MHDEHKIKVFTCKASRDFAEKVAAKLGLKLGQSDVLTFSDGEFAPCYNSFRSQKLVIMILMSQLDSF